MEAIVNVDVCNSTILESTLRNLRAQIQSLANQTIGQNGRGLWLTQGDCIITTFSDSQAALHASTAFLNKLAELNGDPSLKTSPLFVRIGIDLDDQMTLWEVPEAQRGEHVSGALNSASKLQKQCPVGSITISRAVYEKLGPYQNLFRPTPNERFFILQSRPQVPQEEKLTTGLSERQRDALPAMCFLSWDWIRPERTLKDLRRALDDDLAVIFGETSSADRGVLSSAATSDAVGLMEALAVLQHKDLRVGIDEWYDTADLVANRNVIIVGSGATNLYALVLNDVFEPLHFVKSEGRTSDQIVAGSKHIKYFGRHATLPEDSGLILMSRSVFNLEKMIVWIAGNTGMGTQAAAIFLKDLIKGQVNIDDRAVGCVVGASVPKGVNAIISDYFRKWRLSEYKLLYWIDAGGNGFDAEARGLHA